MMKEQVEKVLDQIRPYLKADGGNVELVEVTDDNIVKVRLTGACGCCPMSTQTLKIGVEQKLKEAIPEVKGVEQVQQTVVLKGYFGIYPFAKGELKLELKKAGDLWLYMIYLKAEIGNKRSMFR